LYEAFGGSPENNFDSFGKQKKQEIPSYKKYEILLQKFLAQLCKGTQKQDYKKKIEEIVNKWLNWLMSDPTRQQEWAKFYHLCGGAVCGPLLQDLSLRLLQKDVPIFFGQYDNVPHAMPVLFIGQHFTKEEMAKAENWIIVNIGTPQNVALSQEKIEEMLKYPEQRKYLLDPKIRSIPEFGEMRVILPTDFTSTGIGPLQLEINFQYHYTQQQWVAEFTQDTWLSATTDE
jgi:hypothetical protein